jgi:hypothetical protein
MPNCTNDSGLQPRRVVQAQYYEFKKSMTYSPFDKKVLTVNQSAQVLIAFRSLACSMMIAFLSQACSVLIAERSCADGPTDNQDESVRRIPPTGIALRDEVRDELLERVEAIEKDIPKRTVSTKSIDWWNDIRVVTRAVRLTVEESQFMKEQEIDQARKLLAMVDSRADELSLHFKNVKYIPTWARQAGRIILGHRSSLDDTIQPFSVTVPTSILKDAKKPLRVDIWLHGRDENVSEVAFLFRRMTQDPPYLPSDTIVLQPWGRYSNAFRFAGEVDVFESLDEVKRRYVVDPNRISVRGFSMGGAGCWHLAVHHADKFFAANPGAGFCETERFLTGFQSEVLSPTPVQRMLWNLHDCPPVVRNLTNLPTVAYSGGKDRQKEAADIMTEVAKSAGVGIRYIIHPESAHVIHADAKKEIEALMSDYSDAGRDEFPRSVHWSTYSLKYPQAYWMQVTRLDEHWKLATLDASFNEDWTKVDVKTDNVRRFTLRFPGNKMIPEAVRSIDLNVNGTFVGRIGVGQSQALLADVRREGESWTFIDNRENDSSAGRWEKKPGLQGPIDDAFMSRFLLVRPTGKSGWPEIDAWCERELNHAIDHWRRHFRGEARIKNDTDVNDEDLATSHLICFGTPTSNRYLERCEASLNADWQGDQVRIGEQSFPASSSVPVMIHPNPLSPDHYLVLNSGFTYREYDYLNNARQTPKLGDWAIFDAGSPSTSRAPGRLLAEGFLDENWKPKSNP